MANESDQARHSLNEARRLESRGHFAEACECYVAVALRVTGDARAWAFHQAAVMARRTPDPARAVALVDDGLMEASSSERLAELTLTRAHALGELGKHQEALQASTDAHRLFVQSGKAVEADYALVASGNAQFNLGRVLEAKQLLSNLSRPGTSQQVRSQALNNLALIHERHGSNAEAARLLAQDIRLCRAVGDSRGARVAQTNLDRLRNAGSERPS